jgi:hypothetical protein
MTEGQIEADGSANGAPPKHQTANGERRTNYLDSVARFLYFLIMIPLVGTSGFQYTAWRGTFYPEKFPPAKMLQFYAERFPTTEINYTFYRIPNSKTMGGWDSASPEHFRFGLKAPQKVTHISKLQNCEEYMGIFQRVILGLGAKLGPVLFQLPPTFKKDAAVLNNFLGSLSSEMRVAFEFRQSPGSTTKCSLFSDHGRAWHARPFSDLATPSIATTDFGICVSDAKTTNRRISSDGRNFSRRK